MLVQQFHRLTKMASPYSTNFHKEKTGNSLYVGEDLTVKIAGSPIYIAGVLYKRKSFGRKQVIQIEQTGHKGNKSKDSITFEMKNPNGSQMSIGDYRVKTTWNSGVGDQSIGDNFEIVAK